MKQTGKIVFQVLILLLFALLMNGMANLLHLPIPGSILGMVVLFILLQTRIIKLSWIDAGASWLLAELLLFFIPSAVGVMNYFEMMKQDGLSILLVILISTFLVMAVSGLIASIMTKRKEKKQNDRIAVSRIHSSHLPASQKNV